MKIYINPGHSDKDPGAVKYETERNLNVKVSNYMRDYLLSHYDCEIRMNPGSMGGLYDICADANKWGADLFVSNHFNAGGGDGYEALIYSNKTKALGEIFEKHVLAIGQNSRGVKVRNGLVVLKGTNMPAVLNEGAFVDTKEDVEDWNENHELKKLGEAYAKAAAECLGLKETKEETKVEDKGEVKISLDVLKKGSQGEQVKALQRMLHDMGYELGFNKPVDGDFGSKTETAVKLYQGKNKLEADGIVGEKTWNKLLKG